MARSLYLNEIEKIKKIPEGKGGTLVDTVQAVEIGNSLIKNNGPRLIPIFLGVFENLDDLNAYINQIYGSIDDLAVGSSAFIRSNLSGLTGEKGLTLVRIERG